MRAATGRPDALLTAAVANATRVLGPWTAGALVVGHTIGVGIFLTPAAVVGTVGSPRIALLLWVGLSLLVVAGATTFGGLAARHPQAGGLYVFLRERWGDRLAWIYGWQCLLVMDPGVFAALAIGVEPYVAAVWPGLAGHEVLVALAVIWGATAVTLAGWRISASMMVWLTAIKLLALVAIVALAFASAEGHWSHFGAGREAGANAPPLPAALAIAAVSIFFSFGGFWDTSRIADRVRHPDHTLPLAMTAGVGCVALVYILTTAAFIYVLPPTEAQSATVFASRLGERLFGASGGEVFAAVVVLSVLTSALGLVMFAPRLYVAMAADGVIPRAMVGDDQGPRAPARGTLVLAVLASVLASTAGFTAILTYFMAPTLVFIALAAWAAVRVVPSAAGDRTTGRVVVAASLFVTLLAGVVLLVAVNQPVQAGAGFAGTAVAALAASRGARRARPGRVLAR